ncbi:conserved hypothetical protein [Perkinsus marinus ATCC 50983]|uniref:Methyltransferase small domain-containing protein n=1 Tax=Perkinsus marinus (strain ATCC 50983 / TXsc) TaxID=423536 RepID=C5L9A3_PERM5|nr:conserved hypothetical protein [Perkinsus marinus ATCC 50983]EER06674.1 conserved hypothetical protein [Perkinsus marinus ATCC 50983]|eukprot:XP_002774858.1 conserved hypothetical protein [Perkinsus marinus ATCC 50983]
MTATQEFDPTIHTETVAHTYTIENENLQHSVSVVHERGRGYAWRIWPSAHLLTKFLAKELKTRKNCPIDFIDIGCGAGLVGLAVAASAGSKKVVLTDLADQLGSAQRSLDLNDEEVKAKTRLMPLPWGDLEAGKKVIETLSDDDDERELWVCGSGLVYFDSLMAPLADTFQQLLNARPKAVAYIGQIKRNWKVEKRFFTKLCRQRGLDCDLLYSALVEENDGCGQETDGTFKILEEHDITANEEGDWNLRLYKLTRKD